MPKGKKAIRGFPLIYNERKKRYDLMLTPSAYQVLCKIAQEQNLSISEALEHLCFLIRHKLRWQVKCQGKFIKE